MPYEPVNWYRTPIDKDLLKKLTEKKDLQPFMHIVALLGISAATGAFAFWASSHLAWPFVVIAVYIHCTLYGFFGGGTGGHELSHRTVNSPLDSAQGVTGGSDDRLCQKTRIHSGWSILRLTSILPVASRARWTLSKNKVIGLSVVDWSRKKTSSVICRASM